MFSKKPSYRLAASFLSLIAITAVTVNANWLSNITSGVYENLFTTETTAAMSEAVPVISPQTVLVSSNFETGSFAGEGWTVVNDSANIWAVGAATNNGGTFGAYVSNDAGVTNAYTISNSETSHFYRDVTFPAGETAIKLTFDWKGQGESTFDRLLVYTSPTSVTPVAGSPVSSSTTLTGATLIATLNLSAAFGTQNITLPAAFAGTTQRIIFTWQNDGTVGTQPPAGVDNISVTSQVAVPVCGTLTVGPTGTYTSLTAAFSDLILNGVCGPAILELQTAYLSSVETFPLVAGNMPGNSAINTITIRPETGATALSITSSSPSPAVDMNGANNVIFDGRPGGSGSAKELTISNTSTSGNAVRFINEGSNNIIRYVTLRGVNTSTTNAVVQFSTTTGANGNDNNTIDFCDIRDGATTPNNGIYSSGTTSTPAQNNSGNTVSNNNIFNFFNSSSASIGMLLSSGNTDWTITGNSFYQTATRTYTASVSTTSHAAISISNTSGNNFVITNNFIGGTSASAGGGAYTVNGAFASRFQMIRLSVGSTIASSVQGNTISNLNVASSSGATTPPGVFCGIYLTSGSANIGNISGNTIGSGTGTGSITTSTSTTGGISFGISSDASSTISSISNNSIGSITTVGSTASVSHSFAGISVTSGTTWTINNNTIGSDIANTANSINASNASTGTAAQVVTGINNSSSATVAITNNKVANLNSAYVPSAANINRILGGIISSAGTNTITGNTVRNLTTAANGTGTGSGSSVLGISNTSTSAGLTISGNTVRSLANNHASGAVLVTGIYNSGPTTGTNVVGKNFIHSLNSISPSGQVSGIEGFAGLTTYSNNMIALGAGNTTSVWFSGIYDTGGTNNWYHNSIYIGGTNTAVAVPASYAVYSNTTNVRTYRDNILYNARNNALASTVKHYAIRMGASATGLTSNNNAILANGSTGGVFGRFNGVDYADIASWRTATSQDANSFETNPQFVDPTNATPDLHINAAIATVVEGNGADVGVLDDFDNQARSGLTPVDIGADAGNFTSSGDFIGPNISYTAHGNSSAATTRDLAVTITDNTSVASGSDSPRIYFKKSTDGSYVSTLCTGGGPAYTCTIDYSLLTGVAPGTVINYFVAAQDTSGNLSTNPTGGSGAVNTVIFSGTPNSYTVVTGYSGTLTVDAGGAIQSLTNAGGLFELLNNGAITGNLTIDVTSNLVSESGTNTLNQQLEEGVGAGTYTITIRPSGGALRLVSGGSAVSLIGLSGADRVTINGINSGGDALTFRSTNASGATIRFTRGATNNNVQNCTIEGGNTSTTSGVIDINGALGGDTVANSNNLITNNVIRDRSDVGGVPVNLIYSAGASGLVNSNNTITNNVLKNFTTNGISTTVPNTGSWTISGNEILQEAQRTTTLVGIRFEGVGTNTITQNNIHDLNTSVAATGFVFFDARSTTVNRNRIHSIPSTSGSTSALTGVQFFGSSGNPSTVTFVNNMISIVPSFSNAQIIRGIDDFGFTGNTFNVFFNSVFIGGTATGAANTFAFNRRDPSDTALRDNIFLNGRVPATGSSFAASDEQNTGTFSSNNNIMVGTGATGNTAQFMARGTSTTTPMTFATWQTTTGTPDLNSLASDPTGDYTLANMFVSATDLHLAQPVTNPAVSAGTAAGSILTDFDADVRPAGPGYEIGADELTSDTTDPNTIIDSSPPALDSDTTPTFTFSGTDIVARPEAVASFECRVDADPFVTCTSPHTTAALGDGPHTFEVRAVDGAGNPDPTPASYAWTIDTVQPITPTITGSNPVSPSSTDNTPDILGNAEASSTVKLYTDSACFGSILGQGTATGGAFSINVSVNAGTTTIYATSTDGAGNVSGCSTGFSFTYAPPTNPSGVGAANPNSVPQGGNTFLTVTVTPGANPTSTGIQVTGDLSTIGGLASQQFFDDGVSGGDITANDNVFSFNATVTVGTTTGVKSLPIGITDGQGRIGASNIGLTVTDGIAPDTSITVTPTDPSGDSTPTFEFNGTDALAPSVVDHFECQLNGGGYSTCTSPHTYPTTAEGLYTFQVRAVDTAGNPDPTPASYTWNIAYVCTPPPANMTHWYDGSGSSPTANDIGGDRPGTMNGATFVPGMVGQGLSFDGNDHIAMTDSPSWDLGTADFTMDAWINPNNTSGVQRILSAGLESGPNQLWAWGYVDNGGGTTRLNFAYWDAAPTYVDFFSNPLTITPGQWHHVAVVRSGTTITFYLNGTAVGGGTIGAAVPLNSDSNGGMIGARRNNTFTIYEFANGKLDEIELFSRALAQSELQAIYNADAGGKCHTSVLQMASTTGTVGEGDGNATFNLVRDGANDSATSVNYAFADSGATGGAVCGGSVDYVNTGGTANFASGESAKSFTTGICNDTTDEPNEDFTATVSGATGSATVGSPSVETMTIVDNDVPGMIQFSSATYSGSEADPSINLTVTRTGGSDGIVSATYSFTNGSAIGGAACGAGIDFNNTVGAAVTFADQDNVQKTITVPFCADAVNEPNENFDVTLASATLGSPSAATVTITNDDAAPNYTVTTTGNVIVVTDLLGATAPGDTMTISGLGGNITFAVPSRTFQVDGGAPTVGSATVSLTGVTGITVNQGSGGDTLNMGGLASPSLTVNGGTGDDTVNFNGDITFASNANLDVDLQNDDASPGTDAVTAAGGVNILTSGTGTITVRVSKNVAMASGSSFESVNGAITVEANQQPTPTTGTFRGVDLLGAVHSTGTGIVTVYGRGGNSGAGNPGIFMNSGGVIRGGNQVGVMTTDVLGTGGSGTASNPHGVDIEGTGIITSLGGDVRVRGFAGTGTGANNYGVIPVNGGIITSGGNGNVIVEGTGGTNASGGNVGVIPHQGLGTIASGGTGTVTVTGTGGAGPSSFGVQLFRSGRILSGGAGSVSVTGNGGGSSGHGVFLNCSDQCPSNIASGTTGSVSVTGTGAGSGAGIAMDGGGGNIAAGTSAPVSLIADTMSLSAGVITAGTNTVTLRQKTNGKTIVLGGGDSGTQLGLIDGELDRVTSNSTLAIGDVNSGAINVSGVITQTKTTNIFTPLTTTVVSGGDLGIFGTVNSPLSTNSGGIVRPGSSPGIINSGNLSLATGSTYAVEIGGATPGNGAGFHDQLNVTGTVSLGNATLTLAAFGGFVPATGQTYVIVNNDSTDSVAGTFNGLSEGSTILNWAGTGHGATISYQGGSDNNDVVLTVVAPPPPDTTITANPPDPSNDSTPTFSFNGSSTPPRIVVAFECKVDAGAFAACTSPHTTASLADGTHTFQVRAINDFGAPDPTPASYTWTIDTVAPVITYTPIPNGSLNPTLSVTATDAVGVAGATIFWSVDGGGFTPAGCSLTGGTAQNGTWDCQITGMTSPASVAYYVTAQDAAANTTTNPVGGAAIPNLFTVGAATIPAGTYENASLGGGVVLGGDVTVTGSLTLNGIVTTGANTITLNCGVLVTGAGPASYVIGNFERVFCGVETFTFPVGTPTDGSLADVPNGVPVIPEFTPLTAEITAGTVGSSLTVSVTDGFLPDSHPTESASRYWNVTETGSLTADISFAYLDQDINGNEGTYRILRHSGTIAVYLNGTITPATNTVTANGVTEFSGWAAGNLAPTAATVSLGGRVTTANGNGIRNAFVTLSGGGLAQPVTVLTGSFGYYQFNGLVAGETYVVTVGAKRFRFAVPSQIVTLSDSVSDVDFTANPLE